MPRPTVGILGAGFGGLCAANELARDLGPGRVTIVDRRPDFAMGLGKLGVLVGRREVSEQRRAIKSLEGKGIEVITDEVASIDPSNRAVALGRENREFDRLIVALGADLHPETIEGFQEAAHNIYSFDGASAAHGGLRRIEDGRVAILISSVPFKCPPAPYEAALLVEEFLRVRGVREGVEIDLYTPEPQPMPILGAGPGAWVATLLKDRGIGYHPNQKVRAVSLMDKSITFDGGKHASFDLLLGVPVHAAPTVVSKAGMTDTSGWIPVDRGTLETRYPGVYAIGDVAGTRIPSGQLLPRAGILAEGQAMIVAARIVAEFSGRTPDATYMARGHCFVEIGSRMAAMAEGEFFASPSPRANLEPPSKEGFEAKLAFEEERLRRWF